MCFNGNKSVPLDPVEYLTYVMERIVNVATYGQTKMQVNFDEVHDLSFFEIADMVMPSMTELNECLNKKGLIKEKDAVLWRMLVQYFLFKTNETGKLKGQKNAARCAAKYFKQIS